MAALEDNTRKSLDQRTDDKMIGAEAFTLAEEAR
jgi:hypothetical protein